MEPDGDPPPFWSPSTATILRQQRHRRAPSPILSPVSLILLLPILALLIIFFLLPPFLSTTSQLLRPTYSVKKSWDSFNILLVVFAILCGVFSRRNAEEEAPAADDQSAPASAAISAEAGSSDHVSFSGVAAVVDRSINEDEAVRVARWFEGGVGGGVNRLRRNSSSYPDLRQQDLLWETGETRYRYYDDIDVDLYRQPAGPVELNRRARREEDAVKVIPVDTFEVHSTRPPSPDPLPKAPSPPPPPPPLPAVNSKPRQSIHSVPRKQKAEKAPDENRSVPPKQRQLRRRNREVERVRFESKVAAETETEEIAAPLPEDPPPPLQVVEVERFSERRLQRKKSGAKELATAIASLYTDRKRKKKLKRKNIYESSSESSPTNELHIPPPPPPPPPPAKVFQNLFKKSTKHKRVHSVAATAPPPPPPPPPPSSIFNNIFKTGKSKRFSNISTSSAPPPPPPPPPSSILNTIFNQGNKSRRHKYETRAPPPPPPPPALTGRKSRTAPTEPPSTPPEPFRRRTQASWKPPLPAKSHSYYDEYLNSGAQSPLVPLPPPPPPPFKMPDFKFVARGDFVRILSAHSSRCSSPERLDLEDVELMSVMSSEGGDSMGGPFCPSPDVNLKADSFIARLKGEWRMDKIKTTRPES